MSGRELLAELEQALSEDPLDLSSELNLAARNNMWIIALSEAQSLAVGSEEMIAFLHRVRAIRGEQRRSVDCAMATFYAWHDQQAMQLRLSVAPCGLGELPFGCVLALVDGPEAIVNGFMTDAVEWSEDERSLPPPLQVWASVLAR